MESLVHIVTRMYCKELVNVFVKDLSHVARNSMEIEYMYGKRK